VTELNDGLRGWANYFTLGPVEDAYRISSPMSRDGCVDGCASSMRSGAADVTGSRTITCTIRWAWSESGISCTTFRGRTLEHLVREPSAGNPLARFDAAGCGNGVMAPRLRHRHPKGAATVERGLPPPRHISTRRQGQGRGEPRTGGVMSSALGVFKSAESWLIDDESPPPFELTPSPETA
jgi:hypothetical protein